MCSPYLYGMNTPISSKDYDGRDVIVVVQSTTKGTDSGHMYILVTNYKRVYLKVMENGKEVTKTYYVRSETKPYIFAQNMPGDPDGATEVVPKTIEEKEALLDEQSVVSYTLDKDEGVLGSEFSDDVKNLNPDLDPNQMYFLPEEVEAERGIKADLKKMDDKGVPYQHIMVDGEYVVNDCSTIIVDLLNGAGLTSDDFGMTKVTSSDGTVTVSSPTPNEISLDLDAMIKDGKSIERVIGNEHYYKNIKRSEAEDLIRMYIDSWIEKGRPNTPSGRNDSDDYEIEPED
ncbi:MAG: hypothetical protein MK105_02310 [Crocinitomicaceae bacterium]|nr:hypothetical protein [Crocinitomicaceae bacterium]